MRSNNGKITMPVSKSVFVSIAGGLGNQMFQYAAARALATRLNCELRLDLSSYAKDRLRGFALDRFHVDEKLAEPSEVSALRWSEFMLPGFLRRALTRRGLWPDKRLFREAHFHYSPAIESLRPPVLLVGYWQSHKYFDAARDELLRKFRLRMPMSDYSREVESQIRSGRAVSVHVRRGDYVTSPSAARKLGVCNIDYYRRAFELMDRVCPEARYFLFSDDIEFVRDEFSFIPNQFVVGGNADREEEDIVLMQMCNHNIIANSSFSWWGAWLGDQKNRAVIAPRHWFPRERLISMYPIDLIPENWITVA